MAKMIMGGKKKGKRKIHEAPVGAPKARMYGAKDTGVAFSLNIIISALNRIKPIEATYTLSQGTDGELLVHTGLYAQLPDVVIGPAKEPLALPPGNLPLELPACCTAQPCSGECESCPNPAY